MKEVIVYNSLTKTKAVLQPLSSNKVKIYACGVTVYDDCHIGHAMQAVFFDVIRNFLKYINYDVLYVRNFTDVDDKIIARARKLNISPRRLADQVIQSSCEDMKRIGVSPADFEPKVSDCIPEIIEMIETLIEKKFAYVTEDGDVYYRVKKKVDYGKLSNRSVVDLRSGERNIYQGLKEDPLDFALWKNDSVADASWKSPWGLGRPGWHIECSVMAKKYLGKSIDIHGGGLDLVFPHHENEIAQSEAANSCSYASCWMHSGLLTINEQKMSKSLGNHILIKDFLVKWNYEILRMSYLQNHYRSHVNFSEKVFKKARKRLFSYYRTLRDIELFQNLQASPVVDSESCRQDCTEIRDVFENSMCDDFNTPQALACIHGVFKKINAYFYTGKKEQKRLCSFYVDLIKELTMVLGLLQQEPQAFISENTDILLQDLEITRKDIQNKIEQRNQARSQKNWTLSDSLRDELLSKGILLQDGKDKTSWTFNFSE